MKNRKGFSYNKIEDVRPFVSRNSEWYKNPDNLFICIHCKENEIVKTPARAIPYCLECYKLMALKHDGTYTTYQGISLAKDFSDILTGKVKVLATLDSKKKTRINEDKWNNA
jgi:hypothetical protein